MPSSKPNPNRKSFSLSLNLQLSRSSRDHGAPRDPPYASPRTPLFPASLHLKQEQPVLPIPLTDGLDPSERMNLLRKTRKLSRILGEVPVPVSIEDGSPLSDLRYPGFIDHSPPSTSPSTSPSSSPDRSPPSSDRMGPLSRSITAGYPGNVDHPPTPDIPRARSFTSLRPSLTIPPAVVTTRSSPVSPVDFSWPEKVPPMPTSPVSPVSTAASALSATDTLAPLMRRSTSSRHDSIASSVLLLPDPTPEQEQRARAAKLSRQLGENVPPEVLLRASSVGARRRTSARKGSSGARSNRERSSSKRRLSLDVNTVGRPPPELPQAADPSQTGKGRVLLKKSNSVTGRRTTRPRTAESVHRPSKLQRLSVDSDSDSDSDLDSELEDDDEGAFEVERQRAQNVWRARKMAQVFGNDPPPALFQITNLRPSRSEDSTHPAVLAVEIPDRHKRNSRTTVKSIAASLLANSPSSDSGENLSPLVFAEPESRPPSTLRPTPEPQKAESLLSYRNPTVDSLVDTPPLAVRLTSTLTSPSQQSLSNASTTSLSPSHITSHSHTPLTYTAPASPPPFATMFHWAPTHDDDPATPTPTTPIAPLPVPDSPRTPTASDPNPNDPDFRARRLRAAKLSRFFGVGPQHISRALVTSPTASPSLPSARTGGPPQLASAPPQAVREERREGASSPPCMRGFAASGVDDSFPVRRSRPSTVAARSSRSTTSSRRSQSQTRRSSPEPPPMATKAMTLAAPGQTQSTSAAEDYYYPRSSCDSMGVVVGQTHGRSYSTTVEVTSESKSKYLFLDRRAMSRKELDMHMAIRQLRKI